MSRPTANQRLFVAVYPPRQTVNALLKAMRQLTLPPHRETTQEQLHMTLQFIGDTPVKEIDRVTESVERSASGLDGFELTPLRMMSLPQDRWARLVAAETDAHATLLEIHRRLAHRLARNPRQDAADRFTPHLTLCRFKKPCPIDAVDEPLNLPPFPVERIVLMRSELGAGGAKHFELAAFDLK